MADTGGTGGTNSGSGLSGVTALAETNTISTGYRNSGY